MMESTVTTVAAPVAAEEAKKLGTVKGNKGGKLSRNKRKKGRSGSPISRFVTGKISGEEYFRLTGQSTRRG